MAAKATKTSVNGKQVKVQPVPEKGAYKMKKLSRSKLPPIYKCAMCGNVYSVAEGIFYKSANSLFAKNNDGFAIVCIKCATEYFETLREEYRDEKVALMCTCMVLGCYFSPELYESMREKRALKIGDYLKALNGLQYKGKSFESFLVDLSKRMTSMRSEGDYVSASSRWKTYEKENRDYVLNILGSDPFSDNCYTEEDRRYLFNILSEYLTDDVVEDKHKVQACIQIAINYLQADELNQCIMVELKSGHSLNNSNLSGYMNNKRYILDSINKIAADNGISAKGAGKNAKSTMAITSIMKDMINEGYDSAKANFVDAKMTNIYHEIAQKNIAAIVRELELTTDDYAKLLSSQSEKLADLRKELEKAKEENRLLKIDLNEKQKELKIARGR